MPSRSLHIWQSASAKELDQIEHAHRAVGGNLPGRRYFTQQINHAYVVLLASQFQRYGRNLHTEGTAFLIDSVNPQPLRQLIRKNLTYGRKLDRGNANRANLGEDFRRLAVELWPAVEAGGQRFTTRIRHLETLNRWRNAIAHQDFDPLKLGGRASLRLAEVRQWRRSCDQLAIRFDVVVGHHLEALTGRSPW